VLSPTYERTPLDIIPFNRTNFIRFNIKLDLHIINIKVKKIIAGFFMIPNRYLNSIVIGKYNSHTN